MKKQLLTISILSFLLCACGSSPAQSSSSSSSQESSTSEQSTSSESSTSEESSSSTSSSSEESSSSSSSSSSQIVYDTNPMNEPYIGRQYYLNHIGDIYSTWKQYRGDGQTIAVIDEGFKYNHEDFFYADGTSKVSDESASFTTNSAGQTTTQVGKTKVDGGEASHGTFCAGVAAAAINGKGVVGIAPNASLLLLKTDLKPKSIAAAFRYAADHGASVVTISIGSYYNYEGDLVDDGSDLSKVFDAPVKYCYDKGIPVISAGGNGGQSQPTEYTYPAATKYVIGCGGLAANSTGEIWDGSSYNSSSQYQFIDVFAPSDMMFGCSNYKQSGKEVVYDGGWDGTSFASPQVAGFAALYKQKYPNSSAKDFEDALYTSCHKITTSEIAPSSKLGNGRVDVGKLMGTTSAEKVTVKVRASWTNCYVYAWNLEQEREIAAWPGKAMTKNNNVFTFEINAGSYESLLFTSDRNGTNKSPDLLTTSFLYGNTYNLNSPTDEIGLKVGKYTN